MSKRIKKHTCIILIVLITIILCSFIAADLISPSVAEAAELPPVEESGECVTVQTTLLAVDTMPVPDFCINGLCKLVLYSDAMFGAFGAGFSWEAYYYQWGPENSNLWIGGPNLSLGGMQFSEGTGYNGNSTAEGVFLGGTANDGGFIRIMDDGPLENDPDLWSIESQASEELTSASLQVCAIPGAITTGSIYSSQAVAMPDFCKDDLCMILRFTWVDFGAFGPGLSMPVYYDQDSITNEWVGGPNICVGGVSFSSSAGLNGGGVSYIFDGGYADDGGYARLMDDGEEYSDSQWSVVLSPDVTLNMVYYFFAPLSCTKHDISALSMDIDTPSFCIDEMCTIVRWTDAFFGALSPGLSWPVNYNQNSADNLWIGGPVINIAGDTYNQGPGLNGDASSETIFGSGLTTGGNEGSVTLRDDSYEAFETGPDQWNVLFDAQDDLTAASYYFCSNTCEETIFLIQKEYLPLINH